MITWKILIAGGLLSLILCSILMMLVLYRLVTYIKLKHRFSIRDQHQEPTPRFGGIALSWSFWIVLMIFIWLPFEKEGLVLKHYRWIV